MRKEAGPAIQNSFSTTLQLNQPVLQSHKCPIKISNASVKRSVFMGFVCGGNRAVLTAYSAADCRVGALDLVCRALSEFCVAS